MTCLQITLNIASPYCMKMVLFHSLKRNIKLLWNDEVVSNTIIKNRRADWGGRKGEGRGVTDDCLPKYHWSAAKRAVRLPAAASSSLSYSGTSSNQPIPSPQHYSHLFPRHIGTDFSLGFHLNTFSFSFSCIQQNSKHPYQWCYLYKSVFYYYMVVQCLTHRWWCWWGKWYLREKSLDMLWHLLAVGQIHIMVCQLLMLFSEAQYLENNRL
jgi:hypothetical protein